MFVAENITSWTKRDDGIGALANVPLIEADHQLEAWSDTTAQDAAAILPGHLLIVEVQTAQAVVDEIHLCPHCHVLWEENSTVPNARQQETTEEEYAELRGFLQNRGIELQAVAPRVSRSEIATRVKKLLRQQGERASPEQQS